MHSPKVLSPIVVAQRANFRLKVALMIPKISKNLYRKRGLRCNAKASFEFKPSCPCKATALPRPPPCLAKNILAKYKSTFYQELVLQLLFYKFFDFVDTCVWEQPAKMLQNQLVRFSGRTDINVSGKSFSHKYFGS